MLLDEPGSAQVQEAISGALVSSVNYAEVVSWFIQAGMPPEQVGAMLRPLPIQVVDADLALGTVAGHLRATTSRAGLSLGDRFCLALARREGLQALTADRQWAQVADAVGVAVKVIR